MTPISNPDPDPVLVIERRLLEEELCLGCSFPGGGGGGESGGVSLEEGGRGARFLGMLVLFYIIELHH